MSAQERPTTISVEEYLEGEAISPIRHWYMNGRVFAMAGATDSHEAITFNLTALLRPRLRDLKCRGYVGGMKVQIEPLNLFHYPDVMVTCDARDASLELFKRHPRLIIEVLSRTTEAFDRGEKFAHYRLLESLEEYVLVSQQRIWVECFRRAADGQWKYQDYIQGDIVFLESLDFQCPIQSLYEDVMIPGEPEPLTPAV